MIIIDKWVDLPATYRIKFPNSVILDTRMFYHVIDSLTSADDYVDTVVDCLDDSTDFIDGGDSSFVYQIVDALLSDDYVDTVVDCLDDADDYTDSGTSAKGENMSEASLVLVNSSNYHTYSYTVYPDISNSICTEFNLDISTAIECGDYQAFFVVDGDVASTSRFRIQAPKKPYNQYNPNRNIIIYEQ